MSLEQTKEVIELYHPEFVNKYLKLGWVLLNQYVYDTWDGSKPRIRNEQIKYVLAWQADGEPQRPSDE